MELLIQFVAIQKLILENMNVSNNSKIHITSTKNTTNSISVFYSKKHENVVEWIVEVERISQHTH